MILERPVWRKIIAVLFGGYCAMMLVLMLYRPVPGAAEFGSDAYWQQVRENTNLTPFHTISNFWEVLVHREYYLGKWGAEYYASVERHAFINLAGNVVMFLPLGFCLSALWKRLRKLWRCLAVSALLISAVELMQMLTLRGSCDVDDLILNLFGVGLGYALFALIYRLGRKKE